MVWRWAREGGSVGEEAGFDVEVGGGEGGAVEPLAVDEVEDGGGLSRLLGRSAALIRRAVL